MKGSTLMTEAAHSSAGDDEDDGQALPPGALARNVGLLKAAVYTMSVLIVVGTIVLIAGIIWKASQLPAASTAGTAAFEALDIAVPAGAAIGSVEIDGDRLAITLEGTPEIVIVDIRSGEVVGRIRLDPGAAAAGASEAGASMESP
jgi:hypothetical protein